MIFWDDLLKRLRREDRHLGPLLLAGTAGRVAVAPNRRAPRGRIFALVVAVLVLVGLAVATGRLANVQPSHVINPLPATLQGRVNSVEIPSEWRLSVQVCPEAVLDCDRWLYPRADGMFATDGLQPGRYRVTVFVETRNGVVHVTSSGTTLYAGSTTVVELFVPAIPSFPAT